MNKQNSKSLAALLIPLVLLIPLSVYCLNHSSNTTSLKTNDSNNQLNPTAYKYALKAYQIAIHKGDVSNKKVLTIVDFSKPSYDKRLWVINPKTGKVLMNLYTTQGMKSGLVYATHFSNKPGSHESSLGTFITANSYEGKHGYSLRLKGINPGINNNTLSRDIVVHPANYATPAFVHTYHRTGRSWGCFAVSPTQSRQLINLTKGGSVLFAYAPGHNIGIG